MAETLQEIRNPSQPVHSFTATEVAAAELLLQLSESSGGGGDSSSSFSSSSPRSVNARPPPMAMVAEAGEAEEKNYEIDGAPPRRRPRYRLIADLYAVTAPIEGDENPSGGAGQRREKRRKGGEWGDGRQSGMEFVCDFVR